MLWPGVKPRIQRSLATGYSAILSVSFPYWFTLPWWMSPKDGSFCWMSWMSRSNVDHILLDTNHVCLSWLLNIPHHNCQVSRILRDLPGIQANLQHNSRPPATLPGFSLPGCSSKKQLEMCQNFPNMRSSVAEFSYFKLSKYMVID